MKLSSNHVLVGIMRIIFIIHVLNGDHSHTLFFSFILRLWDIYHQKNPLI